MRRAVLPRPSPALGSWPVRQPLLQAPKLAPGLVSELVLEWVPDLMPAFALRLPAPHHRPPALLRGRTSRLGSVGIPRQTETHGLPRATTVVTPSDA